MSSFKKVLDIEKKYDKKISQAKTRLDKELETELNQISSTLDEQKSELKSKFDTEYRKQRELMIKKGEECIEDAREEAQNIKRFSNKDKTVDMIVEGVKNV